MHLGQIHISLFKSVQNCAEYVGKIGTEKIVHIFELSFGGFTIQ